MRHWLAMIVTIGLAALLFSGAALFAWFRSAQLVLTSEASLLASYEPARTRAPLWPALGARSYRANCLMCHGTEGTGWDQYPGLGLAADQLAAPGGREYLIDLHLYGLTSPRWRAPMPPMGHMQDVELAAVLNHLLTSFGNRARLAGDSKLYSPEEIAARRGRPLTSHQVNDRRPTLRRAGARGLQR